MASLNRSRKDRRKKQDKKNQDRWFKEAKNRNKTYTPGGKHEQSR